MNSATLSQLCVYLVTDRTQTRDRPLIDVVADALRGGIRTVQLRERGLEARELLALAQQLRTLTRQHDALLLINDRIDITLACDADGVHLPTHSFTVTDARALVGPHRLIGVSTHHAQEAVAAAHDGADFAVFGPVFETSSKQRYGPPVGVDALAAAAQASIPVLAIGGVTADRVAELRARGAAGVAVVSAILSAGDPTGAATQLTEAPSRRVDRRGHG